MEADVDLATFRTRITGAIGLSNVADNPEQVLVDGWVNEGRDQLLAQAKLRMVTATGTLAADEPDYELDTDILAISRVTLDGRPLRPVDPDEIDTSRQWAAGTVHGWYLGGANLLMFAGTPVGGETLLIRYVPSVTAMSSGTHDPSDATYGGIPTVLHPVIEAYAKWKAADYDDDTSSQVGLVYKAEWQEGLRAAKAWRLRMRGPLPRARVRGSGRQGFAPGVDTGAGWGG